MPSATLNLVPMDQQLVLDGARQRWIGLPEGASLKPRLKHFTYLSETFRSFDAIQRCARANASEPVRWISRSVARRSSRSNWRVADHWKMECLMQKRYHLAHSRITISRMRVRRTRTTGIHAGYFCSGVTTNNILRVGLD